MIVIVKIIIIISIVIIIVAYVFLLLHIYFFIAYVVSEWIGRNRNVGPLKKETK